jgi:hypothetical protein
MSFNRTKYQLIPEFQDPQANIYQAYKSPRPTPNRRKQPGKAFSINSQ